MREIKFRMWNEGEMRYLINTFTGIGQIGFSDGNYVDLSGDDYEEAKIMQYIGLKDKNGKEIYEGDIVRYDMPMAVKPQVREIIYSEKKAAFTIRGGDFMPPASWGVEVIGNVHENPELLGN